MQFLEKDLEDIICDHYNEELIERGLFVRGKKIRQVRLGNYGIADVISYKMVRDEFGDRLLLIQIWELKKEKISFADYEQCLRYWKGVSRYLSDYRDVSFNYKIELKLVGQRASIGIQYLNEKLSHIDLAVYYYQYDLNGLSFEMETNSWCLNNEDF
jgi:hypothetical protein